MWTFFLELFKNTNYSKDYRRQRAILPKYLHCAPQNLLVKTGFAGEVEEGNGKRD